MKESNGTTKKMECTCIRPYYKHFIISSLEESIEYRDKDIEMIINNIENIRIIKGIEYIKSKEYIEHTKNMKGMIDVHRSTQKELIEIRDMISRIPICK